jgi:hypothetical protein
MMLFRGLTLVVLTGLGAAAASAETIDWQAVSITPTGDRTVIAGGTKKYSPLTDVVVQEQPGRKGDAAWWSSSLPLDDSFILSAIVHKEPKLTGFRLAIHRTTDAGLSAEAFDLVDGNVFQKHKAPGSVSVRVKKSSDSEELEAVEFLDDIVLRYSDGTSKVSGTHTHEITVRKGSVFSWGPPQAP